MSHAINTPTQFIVVFVFNKKKKTCKEGAKEGGGGG